MASVIDKAKDKLSGGSGNNPLSKGSKLPTVGALKENNPTEGSVDLGTLKGKNIIVSVPGAFSPTCSDQVPGYIEDAEKFASKGVQGIYVVSVSDAFVTQAWKKHLGGEKAPNVHFLADDKGEFTKGSGMDFDASAFFGNHRSKRYVAIVDDGTVTDVFVEDDPTQVTVTSATNVLSKL